MKPDMLDVSQNPDTVDALIAEYLIAVDRGQAPARGEWLDRHPDYAVELGQFLDDMESLSPNRDFTMALQRMAIRTAEPDATLSQSVADGKTGSKPLSDTLPLGGVFGEYDLIEMIARGGMGVVFKARERRLDRTVALKMILAGQLASEHDIQRFRAEAQAAARLEHPGIVAIYEVGEHQGLHYFTMAFIEGTSLAERLREGPLAPREAALLARDLAGAIEYAHHHGIVHRDLKPANILIDAEGKAKLTDFGLAKRTHDVSEMTGTGQILGTPAYMSPEQAQGSSADAGPSTDIYGLGALLFALLTGRPPFQAATAVETIRHVLTVDPPRPRVLNPSVPRDLETICLKCLEKAPAKRYTDARALKEDLDRYLQDQPILARPVGVLEKTWRWYRRRPMVGTMAAALALLLIAVPLLLAGFWQEAEARAGIEAEGHKKEAAAHQKEKAAREWEEEARKKIEKLERERTRQLFQAYVNEAAARRSSPRVGRRFEALDRISAARDLADELKLPKEDYTRLRSEAISSLSLTDLRTNSTSPGWVFLGDPHPNIFRHAEGKDCYLEWDNKSGLLVRRIGNIDIVQRIPDVKRETHSAQISADNRFVAITANGKLVVWQVDGDQPKQVARHDEVRDNACVLSPDRPEVVFLTMKHEIVIQPLGAKGAPKVLRIPEFEKKPPLRHWNPLALGRRHLAVVGNKIFRIVDLDAGKLTAERSVPDLISHMAWSPDGATLAVGCHEGDIVLFQPASKSERLLKGPMGGALRVAFEPTGRFLLSYTSWASRGILWDLASASAELRFSQYELPPKEPAQAGRPPTGGWQGALDRPHHVIISPLSENGKSQILGDSAAHPRGRMLVNHTVDGIMVADLATGARVGFLPVGKGTGLQFDSAGNLYGYIDRQPHRWPITAAGNHYKIGEPERLDLPQRYTTLQVSPDGRLVAEPIPGGSIVLDRQTGKTTRFQKQEDVRGVSFHPNGSLIASFSWNEKGFRVWDTTTGKPTFDHDQGARRGQFTPDGKYLITSAWGNLDILCWSVPDFKVVRKLGTFALFAISPDSRYMAAAEETGKVRLTRIDNGELIARFDAPGDDYLANISFSPDGRYLFGPNVERNKVHVWDLWKLRRQLAELKLDWETTPAPEAVTLRDPIVVEIADKTK
jgi:WD40 repeat protein/tRNA A-37 threonylcarbamoyl transferase component Bud32